MQQHYNVRIPSVRRHVVMQRFGLIDHSLKDALIFASVSIFKQYMCGTEVENIAAMHAMAGRRTPTQTAQDFREIAGRCGQQCAID